MLGGGKGSWTPLLLVMSGHLAPVHHHLGNNSDAGLVRSGKE